MDGAKELAFALTKLRAGLSLMLDSVSNFREDEKHEKVLDIFNEGESNTKFQELFTLSFDEEVSEMNEWIDNVALDLGVDELPTMSLAFIDNYQALAQGLQAVSSALTDIENITDKHISLRTAIMSIENEFNQYSPFKIGVDVYRTRFDAFKWECLKRLEKILGPDKFRIQAF